VLGLVRWIVYIRGVTRRAQPRRYFSSVRDEIDPAQLSDWLNSSYDSRVVDDDDDKPSDPGRRTD
jgi:hypothetical protein